MNKIPSNCFAGVNHSCWGGGTTVKIIANQTCTNSGSSDSSISGSFCPKYTDTYTFHPNGTLIVPQHLHQFVLDDETYTYNDVVTKLIYAGSCHYYQVYAAEFSMASAILEVSSTKHGRYIINETESLTCKYRKCVNGGKISNHCIVYDTFNTCKPRGHSLNRAIILALLVIEITK